MKKIILFTFLLTQMSLLAQDKRLSENIKDNFNNKEFDKCISSCNDGIDKYNNDQLSEFYLFKALSYYYLATENRENVNYNSNIKKSVKSLKKSLKKDKIGSYYRIYEEKFIQSKENLLNESIYQDQQGKIALANYIEKSINHIYKNINEEKETLYIAKSQNLKEKTPPNKKNSDPSSTNTNSSHSKNNQSKGLLKYAKSKIGIPYKYGGTSDKGFDCSGFTWNVYQNEGVNLPRTASAQASIGEKIDRKKAQTGDLVFFADKSKISHVGIVTEIKKGKIYMIHASSSKGIRIDCVDDVNYWKTRFKYIKRI